MTESERQVQDRKASAYESCRYQVPWSRQYHRRAFQKMWRLLGPRGRVLDVGCGNGMVHDFLTPEMRSRSAAIHGVDLSIEMVRYARTRLDAAVVGSGEELPYATGTFDAVFARSVLHHLPHPERCVAEIARVLREGGRCVFLDTHRTLLSRFPRKRMAGGEHFSEDHREFDRREYGRLLQRHFDVMRVEHVGFVGYALLGFPDVLNIYRYVPGKALLTPLLLACDDLLARLPGVNRLSLGILAVSERRTRSSA